MSTSTANVSTEQQNRALVAEFMEVFSRGDVDAILSYLAPTATWWVGGGIEGISGTKNKEEFGAMLAGLSATTKSGAIALKPLAWTAEGERVAVETESYSEMNNGKIYNNLYHFVFVVRDGKIDEVKEFLDTEHTRAVFLG
ncbi:nuclear transport factor 2 family protein [Gordonia McavH-238-E]|uniref:nuclear transport factor 2 family protein n=1 Tax=Gordonia sp. McavH-238-E TaxID=2917736 RepID=UPI001EF5E519|nr:nuclear transport factor 2 family protein [Gordonia sp. McavH-238-E]MCG7632086.1 nuclear transport factor 2 family protein [Gordonia sp. McavH-238-E]